ncbi:capsular polysaccharide biosynthesis protein [Rhodosalinus halophilus]|uniref:capsular polysaccharide biosynthesis protein n=1 Tax=Rhodosalinus halophilus TaxID=2259333 RepID=UPI001F1CB502|nr:capsular polysaccharide biosynthesis protein [Rhodosalinus halophilus]
MTLGLPGPGDMVGVWGQSPTARRGEAIAARRDVPILRVEDAFLRSLFPGRARGEPPLGLLLDRRGVHFDGRAPSDLEHLLATHPLDDTALLDRAREGIARMRASHLTKYAAVDPDLDPPAPGYVLVIDQTRGDASLRACGAGRARFREMLAQARDENPGARILIRTHPETAGGHRPGHFGPEDAGDGVALISGPHSPWQLLEGAVAVYTVSSQMGFEAILAGHKPRVFGQPFYAGWGLTLDEDAPPRRARRLTRAQLFAAAMILYPVWYDPYRDRPASFEEALSALEAEARAWREDRRGWVALGMRLWKRAPLQRTFGHERRMIFQDRADRAAERAARTGRRLMVWAGRAAEVPEGALRVEDGFLRSRGLGAELVPPLSLVLDDLGIYYDPARESRLERLISEAAELRPGQRARAEALARELVRRGVTKYNLSGTLPDLPAGRRVLVPGQVEDDASIRLGAGEIRTNLALLEAARSANPDAVILYKPHPDVEAGLRPGAVPEQEARRLADAVLPRADAAALLAQVDEVWTMTSLMGFEALLRGVPVTTTGAPFYAGWGLTRDLGPIPPRRRARVELAGLVHAALIAYPRYIDPVTGRPCPPEVAAERLAEGPLPRPGAANRALAKLQGLFASRAHLWR